MVRENPFTEWLAEVAAYPVVVRPDDIEAEAHGNAWSFSLTSAQASVVRLADVKAFATSVIEARRAYLLACGAEPMVIYWWHDAQAGHLRFSLVSRAHSRLPFGCVVKPAATFVEVANEWLSSPHLDGIPWEELRPLAPDEEDPEPSPLVLKVWSMQLP